MRILFDNGTPRGLARFLPGHEIDEARSLGWDELVNGELIEAAQEAGFELFLTTDKNIRYQQNLADRTISILVLGNSQWPMVRLVAEEIAMAVNSAAAGSYLEIAVPFKRNASTDKS